MSSSVDPYIYFDEARWSRLRADTPLTLNLDDLSRLKGLNERVSLDQVRRIYLPLSRLLNLHVRASQALAQVTGTFIGQQEPRIPYVIGIAGSVAVGKSTTARLLRALLSRWPDHPRVALVPTDGFLLPNRVLAARGLLERKGFPESYDQRALLSFLAQVKSGKHPLSAPRYSHLRYDVLPDERIVVDQPDVLIVEGLNVLQTPCSGQHSGPRAFVSDYFDFSIYVHAEETVIRRWFLDRFRLLRQTAFRDANSYFYRFSTISDADALAFAEQVWAQVNAANLRENILPTRARAKLVLEKDPDHSVSRVALRRI